MDKKSEQFDRSIENFLNNIESLRSTLPNILLIIKYNIKKANTEYEEFLKKECEYVESKRHYLINPDKNRKNTKLKKAATNAIIAQTIMSRNFVISLVGQFDTYIGELIRCVFEIRSEFIDNSEKQLSFSLLRTFDSISDARNYIIEKEVESVLRESHSEQFKWFEKKLDIKLRNDLPAWKDFIELTQRRNLFVHNNGKVSTQYLNVCKENDVDLPNSVIIGSELSSDYQYFEKAFNCLFEIGVKLNQVLRRKLLPSELEEADTSFLNITFELIHNKQYELARELYDFADKYIKKYSKQDLELRILLNRAQTHKWLGDEDKCRKIIELRDWSACGDLFKLASKVLLNDFDSAAELMEKIGDNEHIINKPCYNDWPIFKEFVESKQFKKVFAKIYRDNIEVIESENVI